MKFEDCKHLQDVVLALDDGSHMIARVFKNGREGFMHSRVDLMPENWSDLLLVESKKHGFSCGCNRYASGCKRQIIAIIDTFADKLESRFTKVNPEKRELNVCNIWEEIKRFVHEEEVILTLLDGGKVYARIYKDMGHTGLMHHIPNLDGKLSNINPIMVHALSLGFRYACSLFQFVFVSIEKLNHSLYNSNHHEFKESIEATKNQYGSKNTKIRKFETGENTMKKMKVTEAVILDITPSKVETMGSTLATAMGYTFRKGDDGVLYMFPEEETEDMSVSGIEVNAVNLKDALQKKMSEGDEGAILVARRFGLLSRIVYEKDMSK